MKTVQKCFATNHKIMAVARSDTQMANKEERYWYLRNTDVLFSDFLVN